MTEDDTLVQKFIDAARNAAFRFRDKYGIWDQELDDLTSMAFLKIWEERKHCSNAGRNHLTTIGSRGIVDTLRSIGLTNEIRTPRKSDKVIKIGSVDYMREDVPNFDIPCEKTEYSIPSEELLEYLAHDMRQRDRDVIYALYGKDQDMVPRSFPETGRFVGLSGARVFEIRNEFREHIVKYKDLRDVA